MYYDSRPAISIATPENAILRATNTTNTAQFLSSRLVNIVYTQDLAWSAVISAELRPCQITTAEGCSDMQHTS